MTRKNRFRKLQREQNSTNETTNASKLDETRRNSTKLDDDDERTKQDCTDPTLILAHTVYLTLTL